MRTDSTISMPAMIAVVAEDLETFREAMLYEPRINALMAFLSAKPAAITFHVINSKKVWIGFTAAYTPATKAIKRDLTPLCMFVSHSQKVFGAMFRSTPAYPVPANHLLAKAILTNRRPITMAVNMLPGFLACDALAIGKAFFAETAPHARFPAIGIEMIFYEFPDLAPFTSPEH